MITVDQTDKNPPSNLLFRSSIIHVSRQSSISFPASISLHSGERISRNPVTRVTEYPRTRKIPASFIFQNRICFTSVMFVSCSRRYFDRHLEITFLNPACVNTWKITRLLTWRSRKLHLLSSLFTAFYTAFGSLLGWFWLEKMADWKIEEISLRFFHRNSKF